MVQSYHLEVEMMHNFTVFAGNWQRMGHVRFPFNLYLPCTIPEILQAASLVRVWSLHLYKGRGLVQVGYQVPARLTIGGYFYFYALALPSVMPGGRRRGSNMVTRNIILSLSFWAVRRTQARKYLFPAPGAGGCCCLVRG